MKKEIILTLLFFVLKIANGQTINLTHYTENDNFITSGADKVAFETESNLMWVSTRLQGIFYYKNRQFHNAYKGNESSNFIGHNLFKDERGRIWVINYLKNFQLTEIKKGKLNVKESKSITLKIDLFPEQFYFEMLYQNNTPHLLVISHNKIAKTNIATNQYEEINTPENLNINFVKVIDNNLYCASSQGLIQIDSNGKLKTLFNQSLETFAYDNKTKLFWLVTKQKIIKYDASKQQELKSVDIPLTYFKFNFRIKTLLHNNEIFFYNTSEIRGFSTIDFRFGSLYTKNGLLSDGAKQMSVDRENNIWICHQSGLTKISSYERLLYGKNELGFKEGEVTTIHRINDSQLLVGGNNDINILNKHWKVDTKLELKQKSNNTINRILDACGKDGNIYIAHFNGLEMLKNNKLIKIGDINSSLSVINIKNKTYFSSVNELYEITESNKTKIILDPHKYLNIRKIFRKDDSTIVLCCSSGVLYFNINQPNKTKEILPHSGYAYYNDTLQKTEYFGTSNGLFIKKDNITKPINIEIENDIYVFALGMDKHKRLWIGTNNGVFLYTIKNKQIVKLNKLYNIKGIEVNRSAFIIEDDFAYIGTNAGLNIIPIQYTTNLYNPPLFITSINTNKKTVSKEKEFDYNENTFNFEYSLNSYINEKENLYSYKLIGYDTGWSSPSLLSEIRYTNLPPGNYFFKVKAWNIYGKQSEIQSYNFTVSKPWFQSFWFILLCVLAFAIILWFLISIRVKYIKRKYEEQLLIKNSELKTLKAQINPHLISNIMGSIQNHIIENRMDKAGELTSKYNKFVRYSIEYTGQEFISLDDELNYLDDYTNIETQSFNDNFHLQINTGNLKDLSKIIIPTMILQPIIENSIKHGLFPKKNENCILKLNLSQHKNGIMCTIEDNGVGRDHAVKEIASYGTSITKDRLKIYESTLKSEYYYEVFDLKDENNNPIGTRTQLIIPVK